MTAREFRIVGKLPSANEYINACRGAFYVAAKMKREAEQAIIAQLPPVDWGWEYPVKVSLVWVEKNRRRDVDNIGFARKFILDALVTAGWLDGDGWRHVRSLSEDYELGDEYSVSVRIAEVA